MWWWLPVRWSGLWDWNPNSLLLPLWKVIILLGSSNETTNLNYIQNFFRTNEFEFPILCRLPVIKISPTQTVVSSKLPAHVAVFSSRGPNSIAPEILKVTDNLERFVSFFIALVSYFVHTARYSSAWSEHTSSFFSSWSSIRQWVRNALRNLDVDSSCCRHRGTPQSNPPGLVSCNDQVSNNNNRCVSTIWNNAFTVTKPMEIYLISKSITYRPEAASIRFPDTICRISLEGGRSIWFWGWDREPKCGSMAWAGIRYGHPRLHQLPL